MSTTRYGCPDAKLETIDLEDAANLIIQSYACGCKVMFQHTGWKDTAATIENYSLNPCKARSDRDGLTAEWQPPVH